MKKRIVLLLIAALCLLLSVSALAENAPGRGSLVAQGDGLAAYLDGSGNLMIPGSDQPVNEHPADSIISIDSYRLIFLSKTDEDADAEKTALVCIDLSTFEETVLHENVHAACTVDSDKLYFIPADDRTELYLADFELDLLTCVYTSAEALDSLYASAEGLVATYVENAGAVIYVEATDSFEPCDASVHAKSVMTDDYQVYISETGMLYVHRPDSLAADAIDVNVYDFALLDGRIYYLSNTGSALRLKTYDPELMEQKVLTTPEIALETQLSASQTQLFALGADNAVYRVNLESCALESFAVIHSPELEDGVKVDSYSIEAMSGRLNIYAHLASVDGTPEFTFMEFTSDIAGQSATEPVLIHSIPLENEEEAWTLLQPAVQYSPLSRGSRGEAVSAIQQPLFDHGYYDYYIDGIFGYRTDNAVRLLQGDLGFTANGVADEDLQCIILSGNFPTYDPYIQLNRGNRGLRVQQMQQRLRSLGYLADGADGIFGSRTQAAIQLFQRENNLTVSESATRETLMKLYNASTAKCSSYIDLYSGDSGYRVRELNKRLKELFYLDGSVTDTYTSETSEAVRRFQTQTGLVVDGNASAVLQQRLFAPGAPECSGYSELQRGDENTRVFRLQRRLKELNYFSGSITGYFGKQTQAAVKLFQQTVGMRPTGVATVRMQELLFSPDAPIYIKPTILGTPVISIDSFDKRDGGVYYLSDASSETGYVTFCWAAEGYVDSYGVILTDDQGNVLLDQNTVMTMTTVPVGSLAINRVYTLKIVAYPEDGNDDHVTSASLSFCRTEVPEEPVEIGTITDVFTSIETVTRVENDVSYVKPGTVTFRWYAEGDVASYRVEIRDSSSTILIGSDTIEEQASITTTQMGKGEIYTLYVYAIPTNGTLENAMLRTQAFSLETEIEEIPSVDAPTVSVEGASVNENGAYVPEGSRLTLRWNAVENAAQYHIEVRDSDDAFITSDTTLSTEYTLNVDALAAGETYTVCVTAIAEGGSIEETAAATLLVAVPDEEIIIELGAPVLSIAGVQPSEDGIAYVSADSAMTLQWIAIEGASGYSVVFRDSNGAVMTEAVSTEPVYSYNPAQLTYGAVYSASVTALPQEGVTATAATATLPFIVSAPETEVEPPVEEIPVAPVELGAPEIVIEPIDEVYNAVVYVQHGLISFSWSASGNVSGYLAEILDADKTVLTSINTEGTEASIHSDKLTEEALYTLRVTAIPEGGTVKDGIASEVRFAKHTAIEEETEVSTDTDVISEEPTEVHENPVAELSGLVIGIEPIVEAADSVNFVPNGAITFSWSVEGSVSGYLLEILSDDGIINSTNSEQTSVSLTTDAMIPGTVYTFRVTAIPENGTIDSGISGDVLFSLASEEEPAVETPIAEEIPVEESTEEPASEPTSEPSPEEIIDIADPETWLIPLDPLAEEFTDEDIARITAVQAKLVELLWLEPDTFEEGVLDEATLLAIYNFQLDYNALNGEILIPITEEMPIIDEFTLTALMVPPTE